MSFLRWGGREGRGGEGGQSTLNLERIRKDFGRITSDPGGGQLTLNLGKICKDFGRITSDNVDPGGRLTLNLERICKDFRRIASDPGGGGQLTLNLERIHKDFGRIASDPGGVDRHSTWERSTKTLEGSPLTMLILGGWKGLPRINIVRGNPSKVFVDPFQVECQLTPQDQHIHR